MEFEHGGAGAALELEFEEFGEFEQEIEKGGEVVVEELAVERKFSDAFRVRLGHFYVAVGHLSHRYHPADFFGSQRSEAETSIIPAPLARDRRGSLRGLPELALPATASQRPRRDGFQFANLDCRRPSKAL